MKASEAQDPMGETGGRLGQLEREHEAVERYLGIWNGRGDFWNVFADEVAAWSELKDAHQAVKGGGKATNPDAAGAISGNDQARHLPAIGPVDS